MMLVRPSNSNRHSRRHSSGTNSLSSTSISTAKRTESLRSASATRSTSGSNPATSTMPQDSRSARNASPSKIRSKSSVRKAEESNDANPVNTNRWSHSTSSSISTANNNHRRTSSLSKKRFSLGMSSLNALGGRSQSPSKKASNHETTSTIDSAATAGLYERMNATSQRDHSQTQSPPTRPMQTVKTPTATTFGYGDASRQAQPVSSRVQHWNQRAQQATEPSSSTVVSPVKKPVGHQANSGSQESAGSSNQATSPPRPRSRREKDKKAMLTKALQRANDAVQLDHASKFEAAVLAYQDACELLAQVLNRSTSEEDKRKLITIRNTYTTRIAELQQMQPTDESNSGGRNPVADSVTHQEARNSLQAMAKYHEQVRPQTGDSSTRPSTSGTTSTSTATPGSPESTTRGRTASPTKVLQPAFQPNAINTSNSNVVKDKPTLLPPQALKPRPLSPKQSPSRQTSNESRDTVTAGPATTAHNTSEPRQFHRGQQPSDGNLTWLTSMDKDPRSSQGSSNHSRSSEAGVHRKHIRIHSDQTAADFDAAFDAAVEAAYDDGYEPFMGSADMGNLNDHSRQSSGDVAGPFARFSKPVIQPLAMRQAQAESSASGAQSQIPRQSDSSGFSGRTHGSSVGSGGTTAGTSFSTVDVKSSRSPPTMSPKSIHDPLPPQAPPPSSTLPTPPTQVRSTSPGSASAKSGSTSVRERRLEGQKAMKLKIETTSSHSNDDGEPSDGDKPPMPLPKNSPPEIPPMPPRTAPGIADGSRLKPQAAAVPPGLANISSPFPSPLPGMFNRTQSADNAPTISPHSGVTSAVSQDSSSFGASPQSDSLATPFSATSKMSLKKNASSLSLRSKSTLAPSIDDIDFSPSTPLSLPFSATSATARKPYHLPGQPANTPIVGNFSQTSIPTSHPARTSGSNLFDTDFHTADRPLSPSTTNRKDMPRPFEPCPNSNLLRPFWLMRLLYQTLVHPRGGYLTTECFIPREVWEMKNVKLKGLDEKIASCDLLSAALSKLSTVNTLDADAVLSEMQALENVLDTAQTNLTKKLGNDVGVQGVSSLFKDAPSNSGKPGEAGDGSRDNDRSSGTKTSSKTYLASWRKLRNKSSSNSLGSSYANVRDAPKDTLKMKSVPITTNLSVSSRHRGKDFAPVDPKGPNAGYAQAIAKLCDAAQVLDEVARQVEDPGLRHSSPTHVGLELSTRHAAEFFGFYVCRFILQDMQLLVDKHVKRATEWVGA